MSKKLEGLKYMLCNELEQYADKGRLSSGDIEPIYKLSGALKRVACYIEMEDGGYSERGSYRGSYDGGSGRGRSYRGSYDGGSSGRHYVRGHYSRDGGMSGSMQDHLQQMLQEARNEEEREQIQRFMEDMDR